MLGNFQMHIADANFGCGSEQVFTDGLILSSWFLPFRKTQLSWLHRTERCGCTHRFMTPFPSSRVRPSVMRVQPARELYLVYESIAAPSNESYPFPALALAAAAALRRATKNRAKSLRPSGVPWRRTLHDIARCHRTTSGSGPFGSSVLRPISRAQPRLAENFPCSFRIFCKGSHLARGNARGVQFEIPPARTNQVAARIRNLATPSVSPGKMGKQLRLRASRNDHCCPVDLVPFYRLGAWFASWMRNAVTFGEV